MICILFASDSWRYNILISHTSYTYTSYTYIFPYRKAQTNGLSIIPIPGDPFALPSQNSDPIRGPIYVDLNTDCIKNNIRNNLFQEFAKESWDQRLFLFRESIVKR